MGNDGGTIARRSDLVHTKQAVKTSSSDVDPRLQARITWASCALSRLPLKQPIVADSLGNLYRKEKVVEFLLQKQELAASAGAGGKLSKEIQVAGHLRGLKDVKVLSLTEAPPNKDDPDSTSFVCPLTSKVMNGSTGRFFYLRTCGCVMSESGLRAINGNGISKKESSSSNSSSSPDAEEKDPTIPCPVCSKPFNSISLSKASSNPNSSSHSTSSPDSTPSSDSIPIPPLFSIESDLIPIYPSSKESDWLKIKMNLEREEEKLKKKEKKEGKKNKVEKEVEGGVVGSSSSSSSSSNFSELKKNELKEEKIKRKEEKKRNANQASLDVVSNNISSKIQKVATQQPQTAAQRLALEAKQKTEEKKKNSEALRNLYGEDEFGKKIIGKQQESWMTKGTFTRYA